MWCIDFVVAPARTVRHVTVVTAIKSVAAFASVWTGSHIIAIVSVTEYVSVFTSGWTAISHAIVASVNRATVDIALYCVSWRSVVVVEIASARTWVVNTHGIVFNPAGTRPAASIDVVDGYVLIGRTPNVIGSRTSIVSPAATHISIVNDYRILNVNAVSAGIVARIAIVVDVAVGYKVPAKIRYAVTAVANVDAYADAWAQRCPAIIAATASPGYPGRSPYGIRNPDPLVVSVVYPTAIVERSPTPIIV